MSGAARSLATNALALQATLHAGGSRVRAAVGSALRASAFWAAAILPLAYSPFVLDVGPSVSPALLFGVVAIHACCLLVGHEYTPPARA